MTLHVIPHSEHCILTQILPVATSPLLHFWAGVSPKDKTIESIQRDPKVPFLITFAQHHNCSWWNRPWEDVIPIFPKNFSYPLPDHSYVSVGVPIIQFGREQRSLPAATLVILRNTCHFLVVRICLE